MNRLLAVVLVLSLGLFALSVTSPLVFGGAAGQTVNGDTNGDGDRDISDATYYLRWLFQGGPEPVEIVCPVDQSDRVAELEAQLAAAGDQLAGAEAQLAAANAENAAQAEEMTALQGQLDAANAENAAQAEEMTALQGQLEAANARIAELEGQDNSDCSGGLYSQFLVEDCPVPPEALRSVARTEDELFDDVECQMLADEFEPFLWRVSEWASRAQEDPDDFVAMDIFTRELARFFEFGGPMAREWIRWCELECPE